MLEPIRTYFPDLSAIQLQQFSDSVELYRQWNEKINVISRKDMDQFVIHHLLHSLAIAGIIQFKSGTSLLDVGTGGGFPGIPLAIMFPECRFHLVDSIGKKITVVNEVSKALGLTNVTAQQTRVEQIKERYDFVISRAVTRFDDFRKLTRKNVHNNHKNTLKNGILYLKGGDFADELKGIEQQVTLYPISDFFNEPFFETKKIIHLGFS